MRTTPFKELGLMMMIGDAVAGIVQPRKHCRRWEFGPKRYRKLVRKFTDHPQMTRMLSIAGVAAGVWLLTRLDVR